MLPKLCSVLPESWVQRYKTFYVHNLRIHNFVPAKPFQPSLMFVGKAKSLPYSLASESCFTWVGSSLTRKDYTSWKAFPGTNTLADYEHS